MFCLLSHTVCCQATLHPVCKYFISAPATYPSVAVFRLGKYAGLITSCVL